MRFIKLLSISIVLFAGYVLAKFYQSVTQPQDRLLNTRLIIATDDTDDDIANKLADNNLANSYYCAKLAIFLMEQLGYKCKPGEYKIDKESSTIEVIKKLNNHEIIVHNIVIFRGWTVKDVKKCLNERNDLCGELSQEINEGEVFSGKYEFVYPTSKNGILTKMKEKSEQIRKNLWNERSNDCAVKSLSEALILSSVVAKEAMVEDDINLVASVFTNRLKINMPIQSDPTIFYAINEENLKISFREFIKKDHPYNSYKNVILPPTPIGCPSEKDFKAVVCPVNTEYIYFIGDKISPKMHFTKSYKEHIALKQKFEANRVKK